MLTQSTRFAAHTIAVFFGVTKPVRTPLIGPVRAPQARGSSTKES